MAALLKNVFSFDYPQDRSLLKKFGGGISTPQVTSQQDSVYQEYLRSQNATGIGAGLDRRKK